MRTSSNGPLLSDYQLANFTEFGKESAIFPKLDVNFESPTHLLVSRTVVYYYQYQQIERGFADGCPDIPRRGVSFILPVEILHINLIILMPVISR